MPKIRGPQLSREEILSGNIDERVRAAADGHEGVRLNSVAEREAMKRALLDQLAPGEDVWVFGYGSLIWNPAFEHVETRLGRVHGYHRRFVFWSRTGRGSPENPGLMLGLAPGGSCHGLAIRIEAARADEELQCLFMREMVTGAYHARFVPVRTESGPVRAITFIANPEHGFYAGRVPLEEAARYIAVAEGWLGPCRDYLYNVVHQLAALGIHDRAMSRLLRMVERHAEEAG